MRRTVVHSALAKQQVTDLYNWIAHESGSADRAEGFVSALLDHCDGLATFPFVGTSREDLRPGLRTINFRRRVVIAFAVNDDTVDIIGIFYGGQDYGHQLSEV